MKGLLLKDLYMTLKYCRTFLLMVAIFLGVSLFNHDMFFCVFSVVMAGFIAVSLFSYDDAEKWNAYSCTLPVTKAQLVSVKYIDALIVCILLLIPTTIVQATNMTASGISDPAGLISNMLIICAVGLLGPAILLPIFFHFGMQKGRMIYLIFLGLLTFLAVSFFSGKTVMSIDIGFFNSIWMMLLTIIVLYAASWLLSIKLFRYNV